MIYLYLLAIAVSLTMFVLTVRFLWMVPTDLREINNRLRMLFYKDNDPSDDLE